MAGRTTNYNFPLLDPAQSQPEVPLNEMMEKADVAIAAAGGITVKQVGDSPAGDAFGVKELHIVGATVEHQTGGVALVTVSGVGGAFELTDGTHDLTGVTKVTVTGGTVGGTSAAATLTITGTSPLTTKGDIFTHSTVDARLAVGSNTQVLTADSAQTNGVKWATPAPLVIQMSVSDLATALTTGTGKAYARAPCAFTVTGVRSSVLTASSSGLVTVQIKKNGTTILSTDLSIDASENTSTTAATPAVISVPSVSDDDALTVDITAAGTGAKGLIVTLIGHV